MVDGRLRSGVNGAEDAGNPGAKRMKAYLVLDLPVNDYGRFKKYIAEIPHSSQNSIFADELIVNHRFVAYKQQMPMVRQTENFSAWLKDLRDLRGKAKIMARIQRLEDGNPGDVAPVGDGVSEMRIHFGPGYRVYFVNRGGELIVLLCGGDKSSQGRDIEAAKKLAQEED